MLTASLCYLTGGHAAHTQLSAAAQQQHAAFSTNQHCDGLIGLRQES